jgi:hypothetical protein
MNASTNNTFDIMLLVARPAAGKSEIIAHLKSTPIEKRIPLYHIGEFEELDDFPMLWTWFEEDSILSRLGHQRLHTDDASNFLYPYLWDLLIEREPGYHDRKTVIIEFARGTSHGGFSRAFEYLSKEIADRLAILYLNVPWEESLRKNRARYNPDRPDSILEHGLPDEKLESLYRYVDWDELTANQPDTVQIQGVSVPYVVFENEDDVTSQGGDLLGVRLQETLSQLHEKYIESRK